MFASILKDGVLNVQEVMLCTIISVLLGLVISMVYMKQKKFSKNFAVSLVILPVLIQAVIMMVNGNLGTSVAVLGAFSLVRFRSAAGTAKEIAYVFFAMAVGLATGMGCVLFAVMLTVVAGALFLILSTSSFGEARTGLKVLKITIPETLDYTEIFDDLFDKYTVSANLEKVKTTNLGSMFELEYDVILKDEKLEKQLIDELRCRNGNLTIMCTRAEVGKEQL